MNKIFDFKRFGNYFVYDLNNAKNTFGFSMLIMGLSPVILFAVIQLISLVFTGHGADMTDGRLAGMVLTIVFIVMFFEYPVKAYGPMVKKKSGSSWLMLPASTFEKWLSIIIVSCVIVPATLILLFAASEGILSLIFPGTYGTPVVFGWIKSFGQLASLSFFGMLCFVLGTFLFDRNQSGKTFLCLIVLLILTMIFTGLTGGIADTIRMMVESGQTSLDSAAIAEIENQTKYSAVFTVVAEIAAIMTALFLRIKTMKF